MRYLKYLLLLIFLNPPNNITYSQGNDFIRAVHAGGNWGENRETGIEERPEDYYSFLDKLFVNWAGISVAMHVDNSMDATLDRDSSESFVVPGFTDSNLRKIIQGFTSHGIHVFLSMAIETQEAAQSDKPVERWQLGDTFIQNNDPNIQAEDWFWNPGHPDHATMVQQFWESYASNAAYFARVAEEENVEMFSIGAETDRLFRTRVGGMFPNEFKDYIQAVVDSVRNNFSGIVTYEQHWQALTDTDVFGESTSHIWEDVNLDAVGISSYFQLTDQEPDRVYSVEELETLWTNIFDTYLIPLQTNFPDKPIYFLEFGYVDAVNCLFNAAADEFTNYVFTDNDGNNKDDGREQQFNVLKSFYNINTTNDNLISGTFLWDFQIASDQKWSQGFGNMRTFSIRQKYAEEFIASHYANFAPLPTPPVLLVPEDGETGIPTIFLQLKWGIVLDATSYNVQLSSDNLFSNLIFDGSEISMTSIFVPDTLETATTYYWRVQAVNPAGTSEWSDTFSFFTTEPTSVESYEALPEELILYNNYPNPFNPSTTIRYKVISPKDRSHVTLKIYDSLGRNVITLIDEMQNNGVYTYNWDGSQYATGMYYCRLTSSDKSTTIKLLLIK